MNKLILIAINMIRGFSSPFFNFLIAIFGVKIFGKNDWGELINVILWVFLFVFILGWGNKEYLIRKYSQQPSKIYHAFYSNFLSRSLLLPISLLLIFFFPYPISIYCITLVVLMHTYNALDSLVIYHQKFGAQFITELLAFVIIFSSIFYCNDFNLVVFLRLYCLAFLSKITGLIISLKLWEQKITFQLSLKEFKEAFSFFMIAFSGWIASKIDIYIVDFYLPKEQLSEYQLLITAFLMLQSLGGLIIIPFTKHIYRTSDATIHKIQKILYLIAIPLVTIGTLGIWIIMEQFVQLNLNYTFYILGSLIALPSFFYTIDIMMLMRVHQERRVITITLIGFLISFILILLLIQEYQIFGVLLSICISQFIILTIYKTKRVNTIVN